MKEQWNTSTCFMVMFTICNILLVFSSEKVIENVLLRFWTWVALLLSCYPCRTKFLSQRESFQTMTEIQKTLTHSTFTPFLHWRNSYARSQMSQLEILTIDKNFELVYRVFSLTWSASMQIYWKKRGRLHKKRVKLPQDLFGTPTWPPFHCLGTPIWPPWRHVKTLYMSVRYTLGSSLIGHDT